MNNKVRILAIVCAAVLLDTIAVAQTPANQPSGPMTAAAPAAALPTPDSVVFLPRLPTPAELSTAAAAQRLLIARMEVTPDHVTVVYRHPNGQVNTVSYQLLPAAVPTAPVPTAAPTVVVPSPAPTVIYEDPFDYGDPYWGSDWDDWDWDPDACFAPPPIGFSFSYHRSGFEGDRRFGGSGYRRR